MLHPAIRVRDEKTIEGRGLVATALIKTGEVVSRLEPDQPTIPISDVLAMSEEEQDEILHYCYQHNATHVVCEDGDEKYMNHSCDPNTWWLDDDTMIARWDIQPGEEVTYDYATTEVDVPFEMTGCRCGATICRGTVSHLDYRKPAWQARFGDHLPAHTLSAIARAED